jgi:hypothetical protein
MQKNYASTADVLGAAFLAVSIPLTVTVGIIIASVVEFH